MDGGFSFINYSILVVYSVEGLYSTKSHVRNILIGLDPCTHKLKFKYFSKLSGHIIISIFLLVFVYFIGMEINGAETMISLKFVISTQSC